MRGWLLSIGATTLMAIICWWSGYVYGQYSITLQPPRERDSILRDTEPLWSFIERREGRWEVEI